MEQRAIARGCKDLSKLLDKSGGLTPESSREALSGFISEFCAGSDFEFGRLFAIDFKMVRTGTVVCPGCKGQVKVPKCKPSELKAWWQLAQVWKSASEQTPSGQLPVNEDDLRAALMQVFWETMPNDPEMQVKAAEMIYRTNPAVLEGVLVRENAVDAPPEASEASS